MKRFVTNLEAINNGQSETYLVRKEDVNSYENGKKTSEKPIATKFSVALPGARLTTLAVRIDGKDPLKNLSDNEIETATAEREFIRVTFTDCKVTMYTAANGDLGMTATATGIEIVE